ncbi:MAG: carbohydrate ABC transporter permease [Chloroflexi bacterium]|nr:carbohydrate ABC transporter permease [Chloroflexota bacterium]
MTPTNSPNRLTTVRRKASLQPGWFNRYRTYARLKQAFIYLVILAGSAVMLFPLLWLLSSSFKDQAKIFIFPPQWIPQPWRFDNYTLVFDRIPFVRFYANTILVTGLAMVGQIAAASLVAFGFARLRFPGRDLLFLVLLSTIMIPYQVTLIPTFVLFRILGWLDTYAPLILPYWLGGGAFYVFMLRQFYMRLPVDLDDAARIDGASTFGIYWRIILPQARPALGVMAVLTFLGHWNDFFNPLIYLNTTEKYTLALGINLFRSFQTTQWNLLMAASVMVTLPCILLYAFAQRYFIQGIVFTGLKG